MSVEAFGIKSRWGPPDLDQPGRSLRLLLGPASWMSKDPFELVGILDDGDHIRVVHRSRTAGTRNAITRRRSRGTIPKASLPTAPSFGKRTTRSGESAAVASAGYAGLVIPLLRRGIARPCIRGELGEEVQGIKPWSEPSAPARASDLHVEVFLEVLRVCGVE